MGNITVRSSTTSTTSLIATDYATILGTDSALGRTWSPYISGILRKIEVTTTLPYRPPWEQEVYSSTSVQYRKDYRASVSLNWRPST